jgi:hypothetical protein
MVPNIVWSPPTQFITLTVDRAAGAAERKRSQDPWAVRPMTGSPLVDLVFGTTVAGRPGDGLFRPQ